MSKISQGYDALLARLQAIYPSHNRLTNPYKIEENSTSALLLAYGLGFGPGDNTLRNISQFISLRRTFVVTLCRQYRANEYDVAGKASTEKDLLEDLQLLIEDLENDPTLGVSDVIAKSNYLSDNGIEYVFVDQDNFLKLDIAIEIEYFEDLVC